MGARPSSRKSTKLIEPRNKIEEEAEAVTNVAGNRAQIVKVRGVSFLRGQRSWRGGMTRGAGGQMRPYGFRDGGTGTSAETRGNRTIRRESDQPIVLEKPGNAGGGKGLTKRRPRK
jgi:hypothetical protein